MYPQLQGTFQENLKQLKNNMDGLNWKVGMSPCALTLCLGQRDIIRMLGGVGAEGASAAHTKPARLMGGWVEEPSG